MLRERERERQRERERERESKRQKTEPYTGILGQGSGIRLEDGECEAKASASDK